MAEITIQQAIDLALQHHAAGDLATAENIYRQIIQVEPNHVDAWNNLGVALQQRRQWREAEMAFRRALQLKPMFPNALGNLGECLRTQRRLQEAVAVLQQAVQIDPNNGDLHYNLGTALDDCKRHDDAIASLQRSIQLKPNYPMAHLNLGAALMARDRYSEGVLALKRAIELNPKDPMAHNNYAHALLKTGQPDKAVEMFSRAAELDGFNDLSYVSNALLARHYRSTLDPAELFAAHQEFGKLAARLPPAQMPPVDKNPDRRLRIAYISPDFCRHSVAFFIEPILKYHNKGQFEVICYSDCIISDPVTERIRPLADRFEPTNTLNDEEMSRKVVADRIDILIDLVGHTARNRMSLFARRVAPVQLNYLGYPNTTGVQTMDYRLTDATVDPPGEADQYHSEKLIRLSRPAWCYQPAPDSPPVAPPPSKTKGYITFGSLNAMMKMSKPLLGWWSEILAKVPNSRLRIKTGALRDAEARQRMSTYLTEAGIAVARFELLPPIENYAKHLEVYNDIDIALDTFPYHGTTTTCDSLWMGVPVVTLAGNLHVSRVGASLLHAIGLDDWVAHSPAEYVTRAVNAAANIDALADLRSRLRDKMSSSPLMDGPGLTREIESAYRTMWKTYCAS
jgi:predicted O-linked N-acetylglucosamine transferase (SPINDLY family)